MPCSTFISFDAVWVVFQICIVFGLKYRLCVILLVSNLSTEPPRSLYLTYWLCVLLFSWEVLCFYYPHHTTWGFTWRSDVQPALSGGQDLENFMFVVETYFLNPVEQFIFRMYFKFWWTFFFYILIIETFLFYRQSFYVFPALP